MARKVVRLAEFRGRQQDRHGEAAAEEPRSWIAMDPSEPVSVTLTMPLSMWRELSGWLKARDVTILSDLPTPPDRQRGPAGS